MSRAAPVPVALANVERHAVPEERPRQREARWTGAHHAHPTAVRRRRAPTPKKAGDWLAGAAVTRLSVQRVTKATVLTVA